MDRRGFLKMDLAAGAASFVSRSAVAGAFAANGKVRLAAIGVGQQAWYDIRQFRDGASDICEIVALCDTDMGAKATIPAMKEYPSVPRFPTRARWMREGPSRPGRVHRRHNLDAGKIIDYKVTGGDPKGYRTVLSSK